MKAYKFRIYPSKQQESILNHHLWLSKELWNSMLSEIKVQYEKENKFPTKAELRETMKGKGLYSQVAQELVDRLLDAVKRKIKMKKAGKKCGFPRYKSFDRMKSLCYPQFGFSLGKKLNVTPFGEIAIKRHRAIKGQIKTLALKREPTGKWFVIFAVEEEKQILKANSGPEIGLDLGLMKLATLSDGTIIDNPHNLNKWEKRLAFCQRQLSRKLPKSKNRRKAKHKVALIHEKTANSRRDFLHKAANKLVSNYSLIAMEKLASQEMAMHAFGKSINDAGWQTFTNFICYKAESAGSKVIFVNPENTSKECSNCGQIVEKLLSERQHNCHNCGLSIDRDLNAAKVILKRATVGQTGSNACGDEQQFVVEAGRLGL